MIKRTCYCGGTEFKFIGIQHGKATDYVLKLYDCLKCRTTVAERVNVRPKKSDNAMPCQK